MTQEVSYEEYILISELKDCPVTLTFHSDQKIESIGKSASTQAKRESIPPIDIAICKGTKYIINGHARVSVFKLKGYDKIKARIHTVATIEEVVISHIRLNQTSPLDPLRIQNVVEFFEQKGFNRKELPKLLWLDNNNSRLIEKFVPLEKKARELFDRFLEEISLKYYTVQIPSYVVEAIAKAEPESQVEIVQNMIDILSETKLPEHKFTFPSPDQMTVLVSDFKKKQDVTPVIFDTVDEETDEADEQNDSASTKTKTSKKPDVVITKKQMEEAKSILDGATHKAILVASGPGEYVVDLKNHTMAKINKDENSITIEGDYGNPLLSIPQKFSKQMKFEIGDPVYFKTVSSTKQLEKILQKMKSADVRLLIASTTKL